MCLRVGKLTNNSPHPWVAWGSGYHTEALSSGPFRLIWVRSNERLDTLLLWKLQAWNKNPLYGSLVLKFCECK